MWTLEVLQRKKGVSHSSVSASCSERVWPCLWVQQFLAVCTELSGQWPRWTKAHEKKMQLDRLLICISSLWGMGWNPCLTIIWSWNFYRLEETNLTRRLMFGPNMRTCNNMTPVEMVGEIYWPNHPGRHWENCILEYGAVMGESQGPG